jgi:integrase/recombinase XerD
MLIDNFVLYYATLGKSARTGQEYKKEIKYFARFLALRYPNSGLSDTELLICADKSDAYAYMACCLTELNNSNEARARKVSALRMFYRYLIKTDHVSINPFDSVDRPKISRKLPVFLSLDDAKLLIQVARSRKDLFYRRRNTCIVIWFLNLGLRLSELAGIQISDIYDDSVLIQGKGNKERVAYLNKSCLRALRLWLHWRGRHDGSLFVSKQGHGISSSAIADIIKNLIRAADLPDRISTHKLRHTAATLLYRSGAADLLLLSEILGHASIATTQIYTHVADERIIAAMEAHPLADF